MILKTFSLDSSQAVELVPTMGQIREIRQYLADSYQDILTNYIKTTRELHARGYDVSRYSVRIWTDDGITLKCEW
jgi:hypothetical protein